MGKNNTGRNRDRLWDVIDGLVEDGLLPGENHSLLPIRTELERREQAGAAWATDYLLRGFRADGRPRAWLVDAFCNVANARRGRIAGDKPLRWTGASRR